MGSKAVKRIDIAEFREHGYLQEVNRLFFHPLGLALEVVQEDCPACDGRGSHPDRDIPHSDVTCSRCQGRGHVERLGGIWDYREDPEGMLFADDMLDGDKALRVATERERSLAWRREHLGWDFQPVHAKGENGKTIGEGG